MLELSGRSYLSKTNLPLSTSFITVLLLRWNFVCGLAHSYDCEAHMLFNKHCPDPCFCVVDFWVGLALRSSIVNKKLCLFSNSEHDLQSQSTRQHNLELRPEKQHETISGSDISVPKRLSGGGKWLPVDGHTAEGFRLVPSNEEPALSTPNTTGDVFANIQKEIWQDL